MRGLAGKRVIVTGGASGIGRATAVRLIEEGCQVGIFDLDEAGSAETIRQAGAGSGKAFAYGDARPQPATLATLARATPLDHLGQPDDHPSIVAFLLSDDAKYITGQTISVSGGLTLHG